MVGGNLHVVWSLAGNTYIVVPSSSHDEDFLDLATDGGCRDVGDGFVKGRHDLLQVWHPIRPEGHSH